MSGMYFPDFKEFQKLSRSGNVIPVYKQINADLDTPVSAFLKVGKGDYSFLLESVEGQEKVARYSFLGSNPAMVFKSKGNDIEVAYPGRGRQKRFRSAKTPLAEIKDVMKDFRGVAAKGLPRFYGGLVGYMGYDTVRFFEDIPDRNIDDLNLPDAVFLLTDTIIIFDHMHHTIKIVANTLLPQTKKVSRAQLSRLYNQSLKKIEDIHRALNAPLRDIPAGKKAHKRPGVTSNISKAGFSGLVKKAKAHIRKGDIIQVVLSQRFKVKAARDAFRVYRNLRTINPSAYMFFLKIKEAALVGASPEMLVRCDDGIVQTRPIAGTRPRGRDEEQDALLEKELLNDSKEKAEHLMLVDLGRNDLGRVCVPKTVEVKEFMKVEKYSHVMHLVSEVAGVLDRKYDAYDVLRACFPAGTVTGSPKIRAMEIIDDLENIRRGPYAGCVGYFSFSHNMDTCITIRTVIMKGGVAYVQAGAGIVADSRPLREYSESVNKAKALLEALEI